MKKWSIEVETVITPDDTVNNACVVIQNGYIEDISAGQQNGSRISVQIDNAVLLPGLINAHDHLLGTYYPKVGEGPYENWLPWDNDLKSAKVYNERQQIQSRDLYLLGGYRNLVSGVTSVQDHIPHFVQEPFLEILQPRLSAITPWRIRLHHSPSTGASELRLSTGVRKRRGYRLSHISPKGSTTKPSVIWIHLLQKMASGLIRCLFTASPLTIMI
ncbi:MAG: hypothetical protein ACOC2H_02215 [Spirochaetota bacterium]